MPKLQELKNYLEELGSAALAFSGGVDSSFLLKISRQVLRDRIIAVTVFSQVMPEWEIHSARKIARMLNVRHLILETEIRDKKFLRNDRDRCYWCKKKIFNEVKKIATQLGIGTVIEASTYDDLDDWRPGMSALRELKVKSPLIEFKFTKKEIRLFSKKLHLPTWDKPSSSCLATRIPYGRRITPDVLNRIASAEKFLLKKGIHQVRVRDYGDLARIEVSPSQISRFSNSKFRKNIVTKFRNLGYRYITLDLEGYRMGSMNMNFREVS
ncbi:MAG: ATP-dependent sacrificial sulfur transferase LarE [Candidatus Omnitrophica bacterium]|nr:ATP-dependent sacrificial sulfur transferase LarE [Candidatus Omnitrophota bacterium]